MAGHVNPNQKQDYYAHSNFRLCQFEYLSDVAVRAFTDEQLRSALDWCSDDALTMVVEDNGPHGDGILVQVELNCNPKTEPKPENPIIWMRLSLAGAKALSASLSHIVAMREIEAYSDKE